MGLGMHGPGRGGGVERGGDGLWVFIGGFGSWGFDGSGLSDVCRRRGGGEGYSGAVFVHRSWSAGRACLLGMGLDHGEVLIIYVSM